MSCLFSTLKSHPLPYDWFSQDQLLMFQHPYTPFYDPVEVYCRYKNHILVFSITISKSAYMYCATLKELLSLEFSKAMSGEHKLLDTSSILSPRIHSV